MSIVLGPTSLSRLAGCHPDLIRVVKRAALIALPSQDFLVIQGLRTRAEMAANYGKGRTAAECLAKGVAAEYAQPKLAKVTWLNDPYKSNHGAQKDGYGHAVDCAPFPLDWNDVSRFESMTSLFKSAANQESVRIVCGADWKASSRDLPHIELAHN